MEIILLKNLLKLGEEGKVIKVKEGYARNYLIPQGFAIVANDANFKKFEAFKKRQTKLVAAQKEKFIELKKKIDGVSITLSAEVKDEEEIYGSIGEAQIIKALKEEGIDLEKGMILIAEPFKNLGVYDVKVGLCSDVEAVFKVWIVKK
jgi:large subunit ribosomal protein L9